jgi:hypothetical protein
MYLEKTKDMIPLRDNAIPQFLLARYCWLPFEDAMQSPALCHTETELMWTISTYDHEMAIDMQGLLIKTRYEAGISTYY